MKIRQIRFSNINNLKGEHQINFGNAPLKTAGIFAITGPTGAGKSSILDVITLSLFNRIPRFKKAISKGEIQGLGSIMTHHTKEASASIEYEIKGQVYVSKWSVAKTRNNTLKDYEMELMDSSGSLLDLKRSEVPAKNEEIIGLKYDQFVKSIILSQGQFSRFLKADKNERGQLLENLTGTSIYRKIGQQTYQKFKEVSTEVQQEKSRLEDIQPLSKEDREQLETAIESAKKEVSKLSEQLEKQEALIAVKTDLQNIRLELQQNATEKERLDQRTLAAQEDEKRLAKHERLSGFQGDLKLYEKAKSDGKLFAAQLERLKEQHKVAMESTDSLLEEVGSLTGQTVDAAKVNATLNRFESEVLELDRLRREKLTQGKEQREVVNRMVSDYHLTISQQIHPDEALAILEQDRSELLEKTKASSLNEQSVSHEARQKLQKDQETLETLKELYRILAEQQQHLDAITANKEQLLLVQKELNDLAPLIEKSKKLIAQLRQNEALLRQQKEDAIKIARLENLRLELEDGKPCPLCGAEHHPYAEHAPTDQRSTLEDQIQQAGAELETETQNLEKEKEKRAAHRSKQEHLNTSLKQSEANLERLETEKESISKTYQGGELLELQELKNSIPRLQTQNQALATGIEALEQLKTNRDLTQGFQRFLEVTEEYKKADKARKEKYRGENIRQHCEQLSNSIQSAQDQMTRLNSEMATTENQWKAAENDLASLSQKLLPHAQAEGFSSIEDLGANLLPEEEVSRMRENKEALQKALAAQQDNKARLEVRLKKQTEQDSQPDAVLLDLQREKAETAQKQSELNISLGANQARLEQDDKDIATMAHKAEALQKLEAELQKWSLLNRMIGDAMGNKFSNFAQGLTLQNLLVYANRRLKKLSDRYLLIKPEDEGALKVIDQYQGNSERSVTTLSGGETFLLSLALALSLSDMASKNVSLDSLFIDEGFGTLDQETLDVAMTTLERLQSESQKTVGVISHVEALKERITVQVKLQKDSLGYSQIKVE